MMRAHYKNIILIALFFLITLLRGAPFVIAAPAQLTEDDRKILDLRRQIDELTKQAESYKKNIQSKRQEGNTLKRQIELIQSQIIALENQVRLTSAQIEKTTYDIRNTEKTIHQTEDEIAERKRLMNGLLLRLYMFDKKPIIAMVLQGAKLSEFAGQLQTYDSIVANIVAATEALRIHKNNLDRVQQELSEQKESLESLNDERIQRRNVLDYTRSDKDEILKKTKGQEIEYQKMLSEIEKKQAEFFAELKEYENRAISSGSFIVRVVAENVPPKGTKLFDWPERDYYLTQGYGMTQYARRGSYGGSPHNGIDVASGKGTPLYAIGRGSILASGFNSGFGNWVAVRHDGGLVSLYGHMAKPSGLANGTIVDNNSIIGYEGATGNATGSHLHLSLYKEFFTYLKGDQLYFNYYEGSLNPLDYMK